MKNIIWATLFVIALMIVPLLGIGLYSLIGIFS